MNSPEKVEDLRAHLYGSATDQDLREWLGPDSIFSGLPAEEVARHEWDGLETWDPLRASVPREIALPLLTEIVRRAQGGP